MKVMKVLDCQLAHMLYLVRLMIDNFLYIGVAVRGSHCWTCPAPPRRPRTTII